VIVRGLGERYSQTVLNGTEVASPEPDRKLVPLDVFPASLLEALIVTKTATPDKPGDFAGGALDVVTKEFPDRFTYALKFSQSYNTQSALRSFPRAPRSRTDWRARDDGMRQLPVPGAEPDNAFQQAFRNVWTPRSETAWLNSGAEASLGGSKELGGDLLGYVFAVTYGVDRFFNPSRLTLGFPSDYEYREADASVAWNGIANLSYRIGSYNKIGLKNFYTRSAVEQAITASGRPAESAGGLANIYQMRYQERFIYQGQLTGEHLMPFLLGSRAEWKVGYGLAGYADLDNRSLFYLDDQGGTAPALDGRFRNPRLTYALRDTTRLANLDWAVPWTLRETRDAVIKVGGAYKLRRRKLNSTAFSLGLGDVDVDLRSLPPEQALAPENVGYEPGLFVWAIDDSFVFPYLGRERVLAGYGMLDLEPVRGLRFIGGARYEDWSSIVEVGRGAVPVVNEKAAGDLLLSANLVFELSSSTNIRGAVYQTVVRPDFREFADGGYAPVAGGLFVVGNPLLEPGRVLNGDLRIEVYPGSGELMAVSAFYKEFTDPIVTLVENQSDRVQLSANAIRAYSAGLEFEVRRYLDFLHQSLAGFQVTGNLTFIKSRVRIPAVFGEYDEGLGFQGQSPVLVNVGVSYQAERPRLLASVLVNYFADRVYAYSAGRGGGENPGLQRNIYEVGRVTLDAKVKLGLGSRWELTASGRNLLNPRYDLIFRGEGPDALAGRTRFGATFGLGVGYGL
jgi:hypothetical protein